LQFNDLLVQGTLNLGALIGLANFSGFRDLILK